VDAENGNTLWWDAIVLEMSNVRVAFEEYDGELTQDGKPKGYKLTQDGKPKGYKIVSTHMVFDVKLGENYRRKARLVADGHKNDAPASTNKVVESCCGVAPHTLYARQGRQHWTRACADVT
jgi:hypothetical protein